MAQTFIQKHISADSSLLSKGLFVLAATGLLTLSAKINIPMYPVNTTLQPLMVVLLGAWMGPRMALATIALYLAEGASGLPVFTGTPDRGLGLPYMMGPTGGYLFGFLGAAYIAGSLKSKGWTATFPKALALSFASLAAIYIPGVAYLSTLIGFDAAYNSGFVVFVPSALITLVLAASVLSVHIRKGA